MNEIIKPKQGQNKGQCVGGKIPFPRPKFWNIDQLIILMVNLVQICSYLVVHSLTVTCRATKTP
jgi:hypothetical protein